MVEESVEVKIGRLDEKVGFVLTEIKNLRDGTYSDIAMLKKDKADKTELDANKKDFDEKSKAMQKKLDDDIEKRMRKVEECTINPNEHKELLKSANTNGIYLIIGIVLISALIGIMSFHILGIKLP